MICINKNDFDSFRYAVAKVSFLQKFKMFELSWNIPKSNVMFVKFYTKREPIRLFFIRNEEIDKEKDKTELSKENILTYYISFQSKKRSKEFIEAFNINVSDYETFMSQFNEDFILALTDSEKYIDEYKNYKFLFDKILIHGFDESETCFKYYGRDNIESNTYGQLDGKISFCSPTTFNDPFDVNCFFANGTDIRNLFRIFCVAPSPDKILMWSYYSYNHKGYCFEYSKNDVLNAIMNVGIPGIILVGDAIYTNKRPTQKSRLNNISYTEVGFYIKAAFSKYEDWSHEKEFRFVLILKDDSCLYLIKENNIVLDGESDEEKTNKPEYTDYLNLKVNILKIYQGCEGDKSKILKDHSNVIHSYKHYVKDPNDYKLI